MQAYVPSSLPVLGSAGVDFGERVNRLTGGEINIIYHNPGELAPTNEIWDGVSTGAISAGWYTPGLAEGIIPAAPLFTAFPFGPDAVEYTAWWYNGGGKELWAELSAPYNIHTELCAMLAPEASGWFNKPITSPADLEGLKMRIFGLGASVMEKLGAQAQSMSVGDTMTGLNLGTLDAAELSFPAIDLMLGMQEHAKHYYFPGWHQQSTLVTFIINKDIWEGLEDQQRAAIQEVCAANVMTTTAEGESIQLAPLASLEEQGVTVHKWSDEMLAAFSGAWDEVVAERSAADADFKRVWEQIQAFRADYATWGDLGYVD
ncbi:MAG: C4-dicarboxylate ABC transporter [Alphaproteobacteria bacterium]|nr:MAG: C4-dicarboxylate ABC transporter [Alphaproteobacteria bacterium]